MCTIKWVQSRSGLCILYCVFLLSGCTCVTAGTMQSACSDGQCHCDRNTGACPCRENVAGHNCDQCAHNHWNYGQDLGCEPCGCHPHHALGTHCNMVRKHVGLRKPKKKKVYICIFISSFVHPCIFANLCLCVFNSSQASATVVQVLEGNSALSVSSSTGETHGCSVKVTHLVTVFGIVSSHSFT